MERSNYLQIGTLHDTADKLIGVRYSMYDATSNGQDWIDAIELQFENGTVATVYVDSESDSLKLELGEVELRDDCYVRDASPLVPWKEALGRSLSWIWLLTNQQGYEDGLRFEFSSNNEGKNVSVVTLIGIASRIQIYSSEKIDF